MTDATAPTVTVGEAASKRTIVVALAVGGGMAALNRAAGGDQPQPRILAAAAIAGIGLTAVAEFAPKPAAALAVLMLAAAIVQTGPQLWQQLRGQIESGRVLPEPDTADDSEGGSDGTATRPGDTS